MNPPRQRIEEIRSRLWILSEPGKETYFLLRSSIIVEYEGNIDENFFYMSLLFYFSVVLIKLAHSAPYLFSLKKVLMSPSIS